MRKFIVGASRASSRKPGRDSPFCTLGDACADRRRPLRKSPSRAGRSRPSTVGLCAGHAVAVRSIDHPCTIRARSARDLVTRKDGMWVWHQPSRKSSTTDSQALDQVKCVGGHGVGGVACIPYKQVIYHWVFSSVCFASSGKLVWMCLLARRKTQTANQPWCICVLFCQTVLYTGFGFDPCLDKTWSRESEPSVLYRLTLNHGKSEDCFVPGVSIISAGMWPGVCARERIFFRWSFSWEGRIVFVTLSYQLEARPASPHTHHPEESPGLRAHHAMWGGMEGRE